MKHLDWNNTFLNMAKLIALRSKDPKCKVGAVAVKDNKVIGMGYNGFPNGCDDNEFPWTKSEDFYNSKHAYVVHAEANCILNSNSSLKGATLYVTLFPCNECAKLIIQSGISKVIYLDEWDQTKDQVTASIRMFRSSGVALEKFNNLINVVNEPENKVIEKSEDLVHMLYMSRGPKGDEN